MKTYIGMRTHAGTQVWVIQAPTCKPLPARQRPNRQHKSPYEWGYCGSGPSELAYSLLCHFCEDDEVAEQLYQRFKFDVVSKLDRTCWTLQGDQIEEWILTVIGRSMLAAPNGDGTEASHP